MKLVKTAYLFIVLLFSIAPMVQASYFDQFFDPQDGKLDVSQWLAGQTGFLPVPLVISDPAVGYGGGLAIAFFHDPEEDGQQTDDVNEMLNMPPTISFVAGAYTETKISSYSYWPISRLVLGVRLEGDFSTGEVPFYDAPFIDMRGIPAMRYQGENVFVGELEGRWDLTPRWSLVGFIGSGWTADSFSELNDESGKVAGGGGFRYLIARRYGMRVGLDVARGPEDTVVYLAVGGNWN